MDGINSNSKREEMKKLPAIIVLLLALTSCYEDYIKDFDYDSVYFVYQTDVRTVVVGEGMRFEIGAALGGVTNNTRDRKVTFRIDNSLIQPSVLTTMKAQTGYIKTAMTPVTSLLPLPSSHYSLSNDHEMVIRAGNHAGTVVLKVDSAKFLADAATLIPNYALGLYITDADADSILPAKRTKVVAVKYENMLFGNYWHGGVTIVKNEAGVALDTIRYYTAIPQPENKVWTLKTVGPNTLATNGFSDQVTTKEEMRLTLDGTVINVGIGTGATNQVAADGSSIFNRSKLLQDRRIFLKYKYKNKQGNWCYANDTLTFRNRIRDGVIEWQDENPSHY
jgi:hypothetical protein